MRSDCIQDLNKLSLSFLLLSLFIKKKRLYIQLSFLHGCTSRDKVSRFAHSSNETIAFLNNKSVKRNTILSIPPKPPVTDFWEEGKLVSFRGEMK